MQITHVPMFRALLKVVKPTDPAYLQGVILTADGWLMASDGRRALQARCLGPDDDFPPVEPGTYVLLGKPPPRYDQVELTSGAITFTYKDVATEVECRRIDASPVMRPLEDLRAAKGTKSHVIVAPSLLGDVCKAVGAYGAIVGATAVEGQYRAVLLADDLPEYHFVVMGLGHTPDHFIAELES